MPIIPMVLATAGATAAAAEVIVPGTVIPSRNPSNLIPEPTPLPETPSAAELAKEAQALTAAKTTAKKKAVARSRTIFTSPLGIQEEAATARKTLLGQ